MNPLNFVSKPKFLNVILFVLVFFSISTILSLWSLYIFRFAPLIFVISLILSYFVLKKFPVEMPQISISAIYIGLVIVILAAQPFLFITPFADASADPAAHIGSLAIGQTMPETYGKFSDLEYRYQIGFPLLAKMFIDLLSFVSSNLIVWLLGIVFVFLSAILIYLVSREFFSDEKAGLLAIMFFIGSKIVFQNLFWGQYTFLLASVFFLATFLAVLKKNPLAFLFFPLILIAHPGVALYAVIFFGIYFVFSRDFEQTAKLFLSGILGLPSLFITYIPMLANLGNEKAIPFLISNIPGNIIIFSLWIGLLIFAFAVLAILFIIIKKKFDKKNIFLIAVFIVASGLSIYFVSIGRVLGGRVIELAMFSGLLLAVYAVLQIIRSELPKKISNERNLFLISFFLIFIFSIALFFTSNQLNTLKSGSKINAEGIDFAFAFKSFDPEYKKTLFLIEYRAKIAELSQKIPYDVNSGFYLSYAPMVSGDDPFYAELEKRHILAENARKNACVECIREAEVEYVVAKDDFFSEELGLKKVFEYKAYKVFSR
ncbi:MAG: hypothetical protein ABIH20_06750 [Candidatus Diapherotrites archaeon]